MALIIVSKNGMYWAKGEGEVKPKEQAATIVQWIDKGAMTIGTSYGLESEGKKYTGICRTDALPIVFSDVE